MNCQQLQTRLEHAPDKSDLPTIAAQHLENCAACENFAAEREKLRALVANLENVGAPADFNFRLKARLRQSENRQKFFAKRKLIWLAPATLAAAVCVAAVAGYQSTGTPPNVAADQIEFAPAAIQTQIAPPETATSAAQISGSATNANVKINRAKNASAQIKQKNAIVVARNNRPQSKKEQTFVRDIGVGSAKRSILPEGFSNALRSTGKIDAGELLKTIGVETIKTGESLRVVSTGERAARAGLQQNDLIEKINDQAAANLPNNSPQPLKIIVRRQTQIVQITIAN